MKQGLIGLIALVLFAGNVSAGFMGFGDVEFIPYEGSQAHWKTAPGASVDRSYKLPVYYGRPPRQYVVLGTVRVSGTGGFTKEVSAIRDAVAEARKHGATAVILLNRGQQDEGIFLNKNPMGNYQARSRSSGYAEAVAIKWR